MSSISYEDKKKQQEIRHIFSDMDLCGCGSDSYEIVCELLKHAESKKSFYEPIGESLSAPVVEFIAKVMSSDRWNLLEHGGSVGCSWLTPKGEVLLRFFRDFGTDQDSWPDWWNSCRGDEEW